ncbi:MAG: metal-binding protein [Spirulinaceae cyanobacterium RM2_2_10]|nr:metal-binding protein [Spirulinaceae cyanobacterium SM2_1_0]NJO19208.1 metal-binding protein [Spirulinaceae cyanobacterium RM2_2_10]
MKPTGGRLVLNHSTHIPGLIARLERLVKVPGIATVTPGALSRARGHAPHLKLRISVPIVGGYKLIARQGKTVQEVFVVTSLAATELARVIATL